MLQINRYGTLADLYAQIGFCRKASFFRRVAAMQCVAPQNPRPNWPLCHQLLIKALNGYKIYLDPSESTGKPGTVNSCELVLYTEFTHLFVKACNFFDFLYKTFFVDW